MSPAPRVALLDVNVLVALFDPHHVHHDEAHDWFAAVESRRWASCPLTENGFLRTAWALASKREPIDLDELAGGLRQFTAHTRHEFWSDDVSLTDTSAFDTDAILGARQVTDVFLLALAVKHKGVLATFDRRIPLQAVKGASREHMVVIGPAVDESR